MMINKTAEFMNYRQPLGAGIERSPKFLRQKPGLGAGSDIVDISEDARARLLERNASPLVKAGLKLSREIAELIRAGEIEADMARRLKTGEVGRRIRQGLYDFDDIAAIEAAAGRILDGLDRA
jgi:hypothetical protein